MENKADKFDIVEAMIIVDYVESAPSADERFNRLVENHKYQYALGFVAGHKAATEEKDDEIKSLKDEIAETDAAKKKLETILVQKHHI